MNENQTILELTKIEMEERRTELHIAIQKYGMESTEAHNASQRFDTAFIEYLSLSKEQGEKTDVEEKN